MHQILRVTWQVAPLQAPRIRRHCSRCKEPTPFVCSMKFRTNAQKKRLDIWLIYRCSQCDETWNLPIHERVAIGHIAPEAFQAMARNDPALAMRHASDRQHLARHGCEIEDSSEIAIRKLPQNGCPPEANRIEITLTLSSSCGMRLDRLLASALRLSRNQLRALHESGALRASPASKPLRAPIIDGQRVSIDLSNGCVSAGLAAAIRRGASGCFDHAP